ncbi:MAG TPA: L,D-transpeptidase family protein [Xanthobacteraceae bacterium]|nr:L,D-transpeptidase family protein [Xanthobacteraceae bacterium]
MPGVRFDRLLVSTAVVLLLSGGTAALAEPKIGMEAATGASEATPAPQPAVASAPSSAKPAESAGDAAPSASTAKPEASSDQPATTPAATTKPEASSDQPEQPATAAAKPEEPEKLQESKESSGQPAAAKPDESPDQASASTSSPASDQPSEAPTAAAAEQAPAAPAAETAAPSVAAPNDSTAAVAPSAVADANAPIVEQLRELANGKFDRIVGKKERTVIDALYSSRNYAPLWLSDGKPNERAAAAVAYLGHVDADGLEPADYPVPDFAALSEPTALAEAELRLTQSVVTYVRHAQVGRVHWTRVSGDIFYDQKPPVPGEVLAAIADSSDVAAALDAYEPRHPAYLALKAKLAELRAGKVEASQDPIPNGPTPKLGTQDERVPQLRERLGVRGEDTVFDKTLSDAVKKFQEQHGLKVTGTLTSATVEALNGRAPDRPIDTVIANLERWRWIPHDLGKTYVMVNLPDFTLKVMHDGQQLWKTKIVDGKPNMPTPIMTADMKYITVNPTWNVPPSIVAREYMPVLQQDPTALERVGLMVTTNPDGTVHISQPPGERNALGRLRFNFPNKFLVYQHDTPDKQLFAYEKRAFSHGCMRVQDPVKYAEVLLSLVRPHDGYTEDRIRKMFGQSEVDIQFPNFIPVHLTYQTAFVDEDGKLEFREDVYGRDKTLLAILKSDERKIADTPIERRDNAVNRELLAMPDQGPFGRSFGGGNFFSRLFGQPAPQPAPPPPPASRKHAANDSRKAARTAEQ